MNARTGVLALPLLAAGLACGDPAPRVDAAPQSAVPITGLYEVEGFTENRDTGADRRRIAGNIVLRTEGDRYVATFELKTTAPGLGGDHSIQVIGKGDGSVEGRKLFGESHTQLVTSMVPGVDAGFAFVPRQTSTRIVSRSEAEITPAGEVKVKIESDGEAGENYRATRTRLRGERVADAPDPRRLKRDDAG